MILSITVSGHCRLNNSVLFNQSLFSYGCESVNVINGSADMKQEHMSQTIKMCQITIHSPLCKYTFSIFLCFPFLYFVEDLCESCYSSGTNR